MRIIPQRAKNIVWVFFIGFQIKLIVDDLGINLLVDNMVLFKLSWDVVRLMLFVHKKMIDIL